MSRSSLVDGMAARMGVRVPELPPGQPGDPGLFGPGSVVWVVGRERALLAGGQAALLLQLAHPLVAAGVGDHSRFRDDPMARLRTTLEAVLAITFGDLRQCKRAAAGVRAVHRRVSGSLPQQAGRFPAGTTYDAADPDLALWVHATLVVTALDTFDRFVGPLNQAQRTRYFDETVPFAGLFGAGPEVLPATYQHFVAYVDSMLNGPDLTVSPVALHAAHQVLHPPLPRGLRPMAWAARFATTALLPERIRRAYGLPFGPSERVLFAALTTASRTLLPLLPVTARFWPHYLSALRRAEEGVPQPPSGNDRDLR